MSFETTTAARQGEMCLWVRDAATKGHPHPEDMRCRRDGRVNCAPCLNRFRRR